MSYIYNPGSSFTDKFKSEAAAGHISLGQVAIDPINHKLYRFVKILNAVDLVVGSTLQMVAGSTCWEVTADTTGGADGEGVGICVGVSPVINDVSDGNIYQWIQIHGLATVKTNGDGDLVSGVPLMAEGDGTSNTMAAGSEHLCFAWTAAADDADTGTLVLAYLTGCPK